MLIVKDFLRFKYSFGKNCPKRFGQLSGSGQRTGLARQRGGQRYHNDVKWSGSHTGLEGRGWGAARKAVHAPPEEVVRHATAHGVRQQHHLRTCARAREESMLRTCAREKRES